jgi:hypothetical protein
MHQNYWKHRRNRAVTKGTLLVRPKRFFVPISPPIVAGWLKHNSWQSHSIRQNQFKFGQNRPATKGTLLLWQKEFFVAISTTIISGRLKRHMWHSLNSHYKRVASLVEIGQWRRELHYCIGNSFSSPSWLLLHQGDSNVTCVTPNTRTIISAFLSKSVSNEGQFTPAGKSFSSRSRLSLHRGDLNFVHATSRTHARSGGRLVQIGQ